MNRKEWNYEIKKIYKLKIRMAYKPFDLFSNLEAALNCQIYHLLHHNFHTNSRQKFEGTKKVTFN